MARPRNPRRVVAAQVRQIVSDARYLNTVWAGRTAPERKPELSHSRWVDLARYMEDMARRAYAVSEFARDQLDVLHE